MSQLSEELRRHPPEFPGRRLAMRAADALDERAEWIVRLHATIAERDARIAELEAEIHALKMALAAQDDALLDAEAAVRAAQT